MQAAAGGQLLAVAAARRTADTCLLEWGKNCNDNDEPRRLSADKQATRAAQWRPSRSCADRLESSFFPFLEQAEEATRVRLLAAKIARSPAVWLRLRRRRTQICIRASSERGGRAKVATN